jgi:disulfide bond formation protein DsbB
MKRWLDTTKALNNGLLIFILLGILAFFSLEFVMKMPPCRLCLLQRFPYYFGFLISTLSAFKLIPKRFALWLICIAFLIALGIAIFHILNEEGLIIFTCQKIENSITITDLRKEIYNATSCNEIKRVFGFRITVLSAIYDAFLAFFAFFQLKLQKKLDK